MKIYFFIYFEKIFFNIFFYSNPLQGENGVLDFCCCAFFLNNFWTFQGRNVKESLIMKMIKFHSIAGLSGLTNYVIFLSLLVGFSTNDLIANLIGIAVGAVLNYLINSNWTWRKFDQS